MSVQPIAVPYIPTADAQALDWMERFGRALELHPRAFGINPGDVGSLTALIHDFRESLEAASPPNANQAPGSHAITEKTLARNAATLAIQRLVALLTVNPLVTEEDLKMLGL